MLNPLISIITPTYNHERFIKTCINSVILQDYQNWEMIIIDDGSSDNTGNTVASIKDSRVRYFYQEHIGILRLKETYNFALRIAKGDYIAILEGDDCWPEQKLTDQVTLLENNDSVLCYGKFLRIDSEGNFLDKIKNKKTKIQEKAMIYNLQRLLEGRLTIMPVTALIRRKALEDIGGFQQTPYYPAVEHPTWLSLSQQGNFLSSSNVLGYWRRHIGQVSGDLGIQLREGLFNYNIEFYDCLNKEIKDKIGLTRQKLRLLRSHRLASAYFSKGRYQLLEMDSKGAMDSFLYALKCGGYFTRLKALVGIFSLKTGINIEQIIALTGRGRFG